MGSNPVADKYSLGLCFCRSAHRPAMNTVLLSLDGFA